MLLKSAIIKIKEDALLAYAIQESGIKDPEFLAIRLKEQKN